MNVVDIDHASARGTLKGPPGNTLQVRADNSGRLEKVKKGDMLIVTYTEAPAELRSEQLPFQWGEALL